MALDAFPEDDEAITLEMGPVATITSIKYTDTAGTEQTITSTDYALSLYGNANQVAPTYGDYWPLTQDIPNAVRIRYVTGYTTAPYAVKAAILLLVGHLYENRESVSAINAQEIPMGATALLNTIKRWAK